MVILKAAPKGGHKALLSQDPHDNNKVGVVKGGGGGTILCYVLSQ